MFRNSLFIGFLVVGFTAQAQADEVLEEIVVTSHLLSEGGAAQSLNVLSGDELADKVAASLGETVAQEPGVRSASFGASVGRPVIHGLAGARVKTTEDRIDTLDVATASADHAVTVEPFVADQVTVHKGPSTLLYGSAAIGGVVDVETGRIATVIPDEQFGGRIELRAADNADATTAAIRLDGRAGDKLAWHLDAFDKQADDYEIPGYAESAALRALEEAEEHDHEDEHDEHEGEHDEHDEEELGVLESSSFDSRGVALGLSFVGDRGFIGASLSTIDSNYGIVGGHAHGEEHEDDHDEHEEDHDEHEEDHDEHGEEHGEEAAFIELEQTRFDFEAQLNDVSSAIESINLRFAINDYQHQEIEGDEIGTLFENDAWEGRLEVRHAEFAGFAGTFGYQHSSREYSAVGEEAFVPPVDSDTQSLFWVGERNFQRFDLETGVRVETVEHDPVLAGSSSLDFSAQSFSIGAVLPVTSELKLSAILDYSKRAPTIEELFSFGPHLATQSFEIGDTSLSEESAQAISVSTNYRADWGNISATLYHMQFDDYIYQATDGSRREDLPVFVYLQEDATFTGLDFEAIIHLAQVFGGDSDLTLLYDVVDAELDIPSNENLPRIPASRYGIGFKWQNTQWSFKLDYTKVAAQRDVADFELLTESYTDVGLRINRRFEFGERELNVFAQGKNLTDQEQRHHVSFVKDLAPAPGRRIEAGIRMVF